MQAISRPYLKPRESTDLYLTEAWGKKRSREYKDSREKPRKAR